MIPEVLPPPTPAGGTRPPSDRVDSAAFDHALRTAVDGADGHRPRAAEHGRRRSDEHDDRSPASDEAGAAGVVDQTRSPPHHDSRTASGDDGSAGPAGRTAESPGAVARDGATSSDDRAGGTTPDSTVPDSTVPDSTDAGAAPGDAPSAVDSEDTDGTTGPASTASRGRSALDPAGHLPADPAPSGPTTDADATTPTAADGVEAVADGVEASATVDDAEVATEPSPVATEEATMADPDAAVDARGRNRQTDAATRSTAGRSTNVASSTTTGAVSTTTGAGTASTPDGTAIEHDVPGSRIEPTIAHAGPAAAAPPPAPATPAAASAPAAPVTAPPPPVVDQLVGHVTPFIDGPDGSHEITIELAPAELGRVRLRVTLDDGMVHVRLHADDPASRRLLARSMSELRHALTDAGVHAGDLDVGDQAWSGPPRDDHAGTGAEPHAEVVQGAVVAPVRRTPSPASSRSAVDVLL